MSLTTDKILQLTKQLYPTGRAWKLPIGSFFESLHKGLGASEGRAWDDARSILDSLLPDNPNFTVTDAADWERRLGLATNPNNTLPARMAAILRKMQAPGPVTAKSSYLYLQQQLQLAGFNVSVFENLNPVYGGGFTYYNPAAINPAILSQAQHGFNRQHGNGQSAYFNNVVINSLDNNIDTQFNIGNSLACTFFISSSVLGTYAQVPIARQTEFRQLILNLKQVQNIAILYVTYV